MQFMQLLNALFISIGIQLIMFVPAFMLKTDKLTDISYGLSFIILSFLFLNKITFSKILLFSMIFLWALRLSLYLFIRINKIKKDKRFDGIRDNFFKFLGFWLLQGISVYFILFCSLLFLISDSEKFNLLGVVIWLIGFIIETISDYQKYVFSNEPKNKGKWITSGLWKYSRHPNYFGEIVCWIGIYVYCFPSFEILNKFIALISPLYITFLLVFVSGIPILEKRAEDKWGNNKDYIEYKRKTPVLIPFVK